MSTSSARHSKYTAQRLDLIAHSSRVHIQDAPDVFQTQPFLKSRLARTLFQASKILARTHGNVTTDAKALAARALELLGELDPGYDRSGDLQEAFDRLVPFQSR